MSDVELLPTALITIEEARRFVYRDEDDTSRDGQLIDAVNDVSEAITDHCEREFVAQPARTGTDGVADGSTTFVAATGAFTAAAEDELLEITGRGLRRIVTVTNSTTVVLDTAVAAGTGLEWALSEARVFEYDGSGVLDLRPYDLRELAAVTLYTDLDVAQQHALTDDEYRLRPAGRARGGTFLKISLPTPRVRESEYGFGWQVTVSGLWGMTAVPGSVKLACKQWVENIVKNPGAFASQTMAGYTVVPELDIGARRAGMPPAVRHRLERWCRPDRDALQVVRFRRPDLGQPGVPYTGLPTA